MYVVIEHRVLLWASSSVGESLTFLWLWFMPQACSRLVGASSLAVAFQEKNVSSTFLSRMLLDPIEYISMNEAPWYSRFCQISFLFRAAHTYITYASSTQTFAPRSRLGASNQSTLLSTLSSFILYSDERVNIYIQCQKLEIAGRHFYAPSSRDA